VTGGSPFEPAPRTVGLDGEGQQPGDQEKVTLVRRRVTLVRAGGDVLVPSERLASLRAPSLRIHEGDIGGDGLQDHVIDK
jgi:hypothetical protein